MSSTASSEPIITPSGESPVPAPAAETSPQAPAMGGATGGATRGVGAMGPQIDDASARLDGLRESAQEARRSGRRVDLMRFLRLRRAK